MKLIFNQSKYLTIASMLIGICFFTSIAAQQIDVVGVTGNGINISNPGTDGIHISGAGDDGVQIFDCLYGVYVHNSGQSGVYATNAGAYGGYFTNASTSTEPALYVNHGNLSGYDLFLGSEGWVGTDGGFGIRLDNDQTGFETFHIRSGTGSICMSVDEGGNGGVSGTWSKGGGSFKIDHPLDPENKYLYHSFVESPDMMNVYNGNVVLDENGEASIEMADWFDALNRDFRYQLTPIGAPAPNLHIAQEMIERTFRIAGGTPGMKVSWQVTGIRQDPFANENRIEAEVIKEDFNKGKYIHPREWEKARGLTGLQSVILDEKQLVNSQKGEAMASKMQAEKKVIQDKMEKSKASPGITSFENCPIIIRK